MPHFVPASGNWPRCDLVYSSASPPLALPLSTAIEIPWDTVLFDPWEMRDPAVSTRINAPVGGFYLGFLFFQIGAIAATIRVRNTVRGVNTGFASDVTLASNRLATVCLPMEVGTVQAGRMTWSLTALTVSTEMVAAETHISRQGF